MLNSESPDDAGCIDDIDEVDDGIKSETPTDTVSSDSRNRSASRGRAFVVAVFILIVAVLVAVLATNQGGSGYDQSNLDVNSTKFLVTDGIFKTRIEILSDDVLRGYRDEAHFADSIEKAALFYIGILYNRDKFKSAFDEKFNYPDNYENDESITNIAGDIFSGADDDEYVEGVDPSGDFPAMNGSADASESGNFLDISTFDIGSQDFKEGDFLVSDGDHVYSSFGKYLIIWKTSTGEIVKKIEMPPIPLQTSKFSGNDDLFGTVTNGDPFILSVILDRGRLLVAVGGYAQYDENHVLSEFHGTHVRIYDTAVMLSNTTNNVTAETGFVGSTYITGTVVNVHLVGDRVHIVSFSSIDTYNKLAEPIARWSFGANISDEEYKRQVKRIAKKKVPEFRDNLLSDLKDGNGGLPNMIRINLWSENFSTYSQEELIFGSGILVSLYQVHSIDLKLSPTDGDKNLIISRAAVFLPSYSVGIRSSNDFTVIAVNSYKFGKSKNSTGVLGLTSLISFGNKGDHVSAQAIGIVPGSLLALKVEGNKVQVATVQSDESTFDEGFNNDDDDFWISVLEYFDSTNPPTLRLVGQVHDSGKSPIRARFFNDIAYVATAEAFFFVIDTSESTDPKLIARRSIPDFSGSLHSWDDEPDLILGIGNTQAGTIVLTLFDTSSPGKPVILQRYEIERKINATLWSDSIWDYKAADLNDGYLVLPVDINDWQANEETFHGFMVFSVDRTEGIEEIADCKVSYKVPSWQYAMTVSPFDISLNVFNVSNGTYYALNETVSPISELANVTSSGDSGFDFRNVTQQTVDCFCGFNTMSLPRRAQIMDGKLMTTSDDTIVVTDLQSCTQIWNTTVTANNSTLPACCYSNNSNHGE